MRRRTGSGSESRATPPVIRSEQGQSIVRKGDELTVRKRSCSALVEQEESVTGGLFGGSLPNWD